MRERLRDVGIARRPWVMRLAKPSQKENGGLEGPPRSTSLKSELRLFAAAAEACDTCKAGTEHRQRYRFGNAIAIAIVSWSAGPAIQRQSLVIIGGSPDDLRDVHARQRQIRNRAGIKGVAVGYVIERRCRLRIDECRARIGIGCFGVCTVRVRLPRQRQRLNWRGKVHYDLSGAEAVKQQRRSFLENAVPCRSFHVDCEGIIRAR